MHNSLVSVIIPVYNAELFLRKCIDSVVSQTYLSIEVLLIDDGSTDNSGAICDERAQKDTRVRVIHKKNEGVSIARNVGIKEACGEYVIFLDADDMMQKECVSNLIQAKDYPLVVCGYEKFGYREGFDGPDSSQQITIGKELADRWNSTAETWWWFVWGKLFRRDVIINNNLTFKSDMIYLEDFCFVLDYLRCVDKVYLVNSNGVLHLIEATKYSKYKMNYPTLKRHMQIHEICISLLEKKCNTIFEKMRSRIAIRHIRNFVNFIIMSDNSLPEKIKNMYFYKIDKNKPPLFKYVWKGESRKIKIYWMVINLICKMICPFLLLGTYKNNIVDESVNIK